MDDGLGRTRSFRRPPLTHNRHQVTLVVLGDTQVGKTAIVSQFLWNQFVSEYKATVEEFNWIEYELREDEQFMLQVVFSVDDVKSFEEAKELIKEIRDKKGTYIPLLLIANKIDKFEKESDWLTQGTRQFALNEGISMCVLCARNGEQVKEAFRQVLEGVNPGVGTEMKRRRQSMPVNTLTQTKKTNDKHNSQCILQ